MHWNNNYVIEILPYACCLWSNTVLGAQDIKVPKLHSPLFKESVRGDGEVTEVPGERVLEKTEDFFWPLSHASSLRLRFTCLMCW